MLEQHTRTTDWPAVASDLVPAFAERATSAGERDEFVSQNYAALRERGVLSAGVPTELGGGGATFAELCAMLRNLAHGCASTALALSMHTHLVGGLVWRLRRGEPVEGMLRRVAAEHLVLVSTGASDWLDSSGRAEKVDGGYRVTGRKIFGSGSPAGNILMTSFPYADPADGDVVLHMGLPLDAPGVTVLDNWRAHGMRGTGSNDIVIDGAFVPDSAVSMRRPKGVWHPFFTMVANVPMPLIMSVYVGLAEAAVDSARRRAARRASGAETLLLAGEMENALLEAQLVVASMIALSAEYTFPTSEAAASAQFARKTLAANAAIRAVEKACELVGGAAYYRETGLERALRDVRAAHFHPMQEKRQLLMTGRISLAAAADGR